MTTVILQRSIQISPQEAHLGQLQVVDLAALSGVTGGAWRLEERRGRRLAGQGSDTDKDLKIEFVRSSERWFWPLVVTESETICRCSLWPWAEVIFRIWVWSSGPVCSWVLALLGIEERTEGGREYQVTCYPREHVEKWSSGLRTGVGLFACPPPPPPPAELRSTRPGSLS
ncbi:hypothetical protein OIU77_012469 [Salix suchowensis]|uniref:Uncharacterized protein n=1 Tax=Salix suchowensis TaxID=1278906 RepID=A0ABQ9A5Z6_9ROSI|nr:hypothetical protein OIU77_012469 [Salix suchowensis]